MGSPLQSKITRVSNRPPTPRLHGDATNCVLDTPFASDLILIPGSWHPSAGLLQSTKSVQMRLQCRNCRVCPMRMDKPNHWVLRYLFLALLELLHAPYTPNRACDKASAITRIVLISATNMVARSVSGRVHIPAALPYRSPSVSHLGSITMYAPE